jgi:hypothetical protein
METLCRLSYWGVLPLSRSDYDSTQRSPGTGNRVPCLVLRQCTNVSTVSSRAPRARTVLAASHASNRSSESGREIR